MGNLKSSSLPPSPISSPVISSRSLVSSLVIKDISLEEISNIKFDDVWTSFRKYEDNFGIHYCYINFDQFNEIFTNIFGSKCHYYFNIFKNNTTTNNNDIASIVANKFEEYKEYGTWNYPNSSTYVDVLQVFSAIIVICDHKHINFDEKLNFLLKIFQMNTLFDNAIDNNNHYDKNLIHRDTILNMIESCLIGLLNLHTNTVTNINDDADNNNYKFCGNVPRINTKHITNAVVDSIYVKTDFVYDGLKPTTQLLLAWHIIKVQLCQQNIVVEFLQNFIDILFFPGLLSKCTPFYETLSAEYLVRQNFPMISKMNVKGSFRTRVRQSKIDIRTRKRWGVVSDNLQNIISDNNNNHNNDNNNNNNDNNNNDNNKSTKSKDLLRSKMTSTMIMKIDSCLEILLGTNCTITNCPEWDNLNTYQDSLYRGLQAFSIVDERLTRELFLKFSAAIVSFNTIDSMSQRNGLIYRNHQQSILLLYLTLIKVEVTAKDYDDYNTFIASHGNRNLPEDTIDRNVFIDYAIFYHKGQVLMKEIEIKMGYDIMDFLDPEDGKINEEKIQLATRELFDNTLKKKIIFKSEFTKEILEEHINHVVECLMEDIRLMKSTSSFFVVDLKDKISKVCDYIISIEKVEKQFHS